MNKLMGKHSPGVVHDMWVSTKCHTAEELMELTKDGAKSPEEMGFVRVAPSKTSGGKND